MTTVRYWQQGDLPYLLWAAAQMSWDILPEDDRAVAAPEVVAWSAQSDLLQALQSPGGTALVAEDEGRPVGFLLVTVLPDELTGTFHGYMADIYIDPPNRGRGLARELHRLGEEHLRQLGLTVVTNWTHAHNQAGQILSQRNGFTPWAVMMTRSLKSDE